MKIENNKNKNNINDIGTKQASSWYQLKNIIYIFHVYL